MSDETVNSQWRPATHDDLETIDRIGNDIHDQLPERREVFAQKFKLFPEGCCVLVQNTEVVGYGLSHPWRLYDVPPLDTFLRVLPSSPECLYIHDVIVLPQARGRGAAGVYVDSIARLAQQRVIGFLALVSTYNTHSLWARFEFEVVSHPSLAEKLNSYGPTARYMIRRLGYA